MVSGVVVFKESGEIVYVFTAVSLIVFESLFSICKK